MARMISLNSLSSPAETGRRVRAAGELGQSPAAPGMCLRLTVETEFLESGNEWPCAIRFLPAGPEKGDIGAADRRPR